MKAMYKVAILSVITAVLIMLWLPRFIVGKPALAEGEALGSTIGGVEVGDLKGDELKNALQVAVSEWMKQPVVVAGGGATLSISTDQFQFDIESTVNDYEENYQKSWYAFWDGETTVDLPLNVTTNESLKNELAAVTGWKQEETYAKIIANASYLKGEEIAAEVSNLSALESERIFLSITKIPAGALALSELVTALNNQVIAPDETFSLLASVQPNLFLASNEANDFIASVLYEAMLNTEAEILERHSQNKVPSYLQPGVEATVDAVAKKDLSFKNISDNPMVIKMMIEGENLKLEIYSNAIGATVSMRVNKDEKVKARTINRYTDQLAIGSVQEIQQGQEGLRVSVYRTIDGVEELIARDYYTPIHRILLNSSRQPEPVVETTETITPDTSEGTTTDSATTSSKDPDLEVDLDGDGFADTELTTSNKKEPQVSKTTGGVMSSDGSDETSDKGSNLIKKDEEKGE